jgi:hypothetical protein
VYLDAAIIALMNYATFFTRSLPSRSIQGFAMPKQQDFQDLQQGWEAVPEFQATHLIQEFFFVRLLLLCLAGVKRSCCSLVIIRDDPLYCCCMAERGTEFCDNAAISFEWFWYTLPSSPLHQGTCPTSAWHL